MELENNSTDKPYTILFKQILYSSLIIFLVFVITVTSFSCLFLFHTVILKPSIWLLLFDYISYYLISNNSKLTKVSFLLNIISFIRYSNALRSSFVNEKGYFCCKNTSLIFHATIDMIFSCGSSNADRFSVTIFPIRKEYVV